MNFVSNYHVEVVGAQVFLLLVGERGGGAVRVLDEGVLVGRLVEVLRLVVAELEMGGAQSLLVLIRFLGERILADTRELLDLLRLVVEARLRSRDERIRFARRDGKD